MPARFETPAAVALAAALLALPACKKKDAAPDGPGMNLSADRKLLPLGQNKLKQIGLAIHNFHDTTGRLPAGVVGPDGKTTGLSWRVQILPYVEEEGLYKQFRLNEAWDSEHNRRLVARMPKIYLPPGVEDYGGHTFYQSFVGDGAFIPKPQSQRFLGVAGGPVHGLRFADITDGLMHTVVVAEAAEPVIWTKPDDIPFDPNGSVPELGGVFRDGVNVLMGDGAVYYLRKNELSPEKLRAMITVNAGERVEMP
jgi:hypothetical protein